jgi:predicted enzyme related to lactoylglutathione lyase
MGNPVVHWELMSKEPQRVAAFYQEVFDWKVEHRPELNYRVVDTLAKGEMKGINGGIVKPDREGPWPAWAASRSSPIPKAA